MPLPDPQKIARLSRDRSFLVRTSLTMVTASVAIAFVVSLLSSSDISEPELYRELLDQSETPETMDELVTLVRFGRVAPPDPDFRDCRDLVRGTDSVWSVEQIEQIAGAFPSAIVEPWWKNLRGGDTDIAIAEILAAAPDQRYRDEFLGDLYYLRGDWQKAMAYYIAGAKRFPDSIYARRSAVVLAMRENELPALDIGDFKSVFHPAELLEIYSASRDYPALIVATLRTEWSMLTSRYLAPALFTAAIWWAVFMVFWTPTRERMIAAALAFLAGVVSAVLTLFVVVVQEKIQGFTFNPQDTPIAQFLNLVAGVGLREETLKLLCYVPFAVWAARRKSGIEGIVLAAIVGLGFAFQENLQYFQNGAGTFVAWGRLLSANALHFSLTGVAGYFLFRMLLRKMRGWEEFLACFLAVIFVHGIYNAMFLMPLLAEYASLYFIIIALIAYQFFDRLRAEMDTTGIAKRVSPLGIFVLGSVVLTCVVLISSATLLPFRFALGAFASSVGGSVVLAFAFISRFRDL